MKIKSAKFVRGAVSPKDFPGDLPEIAVVGRSNVGKSSLLNYLLSRKKLVSTSRTPGKTRQLNYFNINELFYFVDVPGFGYAKLSQVEKHQMLKMIETYFLKSPKIVGVLYLFDLRVPSSSVDKESLAWIKQFGLPTLYLGTKSDKLTRNEKMKALAELKSKYELAIAPLPTSTLNKEGKDAVWEQISDLLGFSS